MKISVHDNCRYRMYREQIMRNNKWTLISRMYKELVTHYYVYNPNKFNVNITFYRNIPFSSVELCYH